MIDQPSHAYDARRAARVLRYAALVYAVGLLPNLRKVVLLPGCGHWTQQERPDDVNAELIDFLRREIGR